MKVYVINENGTIHPQAHTGLKTACDIAKVSYVQASRGKRIFKTGDTNRYVVILELQVVRIKRDPKQARKAIGKATTTPNQKDNTKHYEPLDDWSQNKFSQKELL